MIYIIFQIVNIFLLKARIFTDLHVDAPRIPWHPRTTVKNRCLDKTIIDRKQCLSNSSCFKHFNQTVPQGHETHYFIQNMFQLSFFFSTPNLNSHKNHQLRPCSVQHHTSTHELRSQMKCCTHSAVESTGGSYKFSRLAPFLPSN